MGTRAMGENPNPLYAVKEDSQLKWGSRIQQSTIYDAESQLIRGTMSFSKDKLQELDPSYTGYTHVFVLRLPAFMTAIADGRIQGDFVSLNLEFCNQNVLQFAKNLFLSHLHSPLLFQR